MEIAKISKNLDFLSFLDNAFYKGNIIKSHLSNYSLDLYEDYQFLMAHYINKVKSNKVLIYIKDSTIFPLPTAPTLSYVTGDAQSWSHRLFQQKKLDFINVLKIPSEKIILLLEFISKNFIDQYKEYLFLLPADNDNFGQDLLTTTKKLFDYQQTILYSMNHHFSIPGQTFPPLNSLITDHLCFSHDLMQNEFINNRHTNMAHWLWNYHLNKNQNWLSL